MMYNFENRVVLLGDSRGMHGMHMVHIENKNPLM